MKALMKLWRRLRREEQGVTIVTVSVLMVLLMGFAAIAVDAGWLYWSKRMMQNAVDSAATAGARELLLDASNEAGAFATAYAYADQNGVTAAEIDAVTDPTYQMQVSTALTPWGYPALRVSAQREVPPWFAAVFGAPDSLVRVTATAVVAPSNEGCDFWPFAIEEGWAPIGGGEVQLHFEQRGSDDFGPGTAGAIRMPDDQGGMDYRRNVEWGSCGVTVPMDVYPEPGNKEGPSFMGGQAAIDRCGHPEYCIAISGPDAGHLTNHPVCADTCRMQYNGDAGGPSVCENVGSWPDTRCSRIGLVPVLRAGDWANANGAADTVRIVDITKFYLTRVEGGYIYGYFIPEAITVGTPSYGGPAGLGDGVFLWQ